MNSGDIAWMLMSSALVLLMTPGLAFFYSGLVRERNAINTIKMSFIALAVIAIEWALVGYSLSFSEGNAFLGGLSWIGLSGVGLEPNPTYGETIPHLMFMVFQMMFAIITPALISGAVVGRMKFKAYVAFILLWGLFIYNPLAHWVWGGGWLSDLGALDFAGGTVVHISAGFSALIAAAILGPRNTEGKTQEMPHNIPFVILGASLLWFGWFGFNAGSALSAGSLATLAFVTTNLSAAAAVVTWMLLNLVRGEKPSAIGSAISAVVGLVAITPAAGFVTPMSALLIGSISTVISFFAIQFFKKGRIDDTLDVFACHGLGGLSGAILTGVFATTSVNPAGANGLLYGNPGLLLTQCIAIAATIAYCVVGTAGILYFLKATIGLRTSSESELRGLDAMEHGEDAYVLESTALNSTKL